MASEPVLGGGRVSHVAGCWKSSPGRWNSKCKSLGAIKGRRRPPDRPERRVKRPRGGAEEGRIYDKQQKSVSHLIRFHQDYGIYKDKQKRFP